MGAFSDLRIYVAVTSPYPWDRGVTAGFWALGAGREKLFILCLVELDNERFDRLLLIEDVTLRHDLFVSD